MGRFASRPVIMRMTRLVLLAVVVFACYNITDTDGPSTPVATVTVLPAQATIAVGASRQLSAVLADADGQTLGGRDVVWTSSQESVATVTDGRVVGVGPGTATITARSEGIDGGATITVEGAAPAPVAGVAVTPASRTMTAGQSYQFEATLTDASGGVLTGRTVDWRTSASGVATVSSSGLVRAVATGTATITATSEGKSGTATVTVEAAAPPAVATVTVSPASQTLVLGTTYQLTATLKDGSGAVLSGRTIEWRTSAAGVATVSTSGLVTAAGVGTATITAISEGKSGTSSITVREPPTTNDVVLVGAGDISKCSNDNDEATAKLLDNIAGEVFLAGDNAYDSGTLTEYTNCYGPTWGRHKARTHPSPGNHEYNTSGATGYYDYFGAAAGERTKGYYSYDLGAWHVIALNSNISMSAGSAQETWLRADLAASTKACTLAYWHHPRFSSSEHGNQSQVAPLFKALYDLGAEIVVSGHDHSYERFAPQNPSAAADPAKGIRLFVVGTGGASPYSFGTPEPNSEVRITGKFGVIRFVLGDGTYRWEFITTPSGAIADSGTGVCH